LSPGVLKSSSMIEMVTTWLVGAMIAWVPPLHDSDRVRYESIAKDLVAVAFDAQEQPVFTGDGGRAKTALLMASIASVESGDRADVDDGRVTGDHGRSFCLMQVQVVGKTAEGWTGQDLTSDRKKCFRAALKRIRISFDWCKDHAIEDRLAGYTSGLCRDGEQLARNRFWRARNYWSKTPFLPPDDLVP
jgi:hypothetical protein